MNILVTGAKGFVGKNLCAQLKNIRDGKARCYGDLVIDEVFEYDIDSTPEELDEYCQKADFVFNLAGVNRPKDQSEFMAGNFGFASTLLDTLKKHKNTCPVMLSSSQQASLTGRFGNSEYGRSKKAGEELFLEYGKETGARVLVYRFPNLFGKWCRPNYNSAVATFCNAFANDLPYTVNDPSVELELLYIDDLVEEMIACLKGQEHRCDFDGLEVIPYNSNKDQELENLRIKATNRDETDSTNKEFSNSQILDEKRGRYCYVPTTHKATLGHIVELLKSFAEQPKTLMIPEIPAGSFAKKLYSTYLSYLPYEKTAFPLKMNVDARGSFTELVHTLNCGQVSINISKPGITKGQHWHHTKFEQFIVVKGHGLIQQRSLSQPSPQGRAIASSQVPPLEGEARKGLSPLEGEARKGLSPLEGEARKGLSPLEGEAKRGLPIYHTADPTTYNVLKENSEKMRKNPTEAEAAMWEMLRGKNLDAKFRRQHIIGEYITDFVCLDKQLVIEIDGGYHNEPEQQQLDKQRTDFLQSIGFSVLRFSNEEVMFKSDETLSIIRNALKHLTPPLEGEAGRGPVLNWFVSGDHIQAVHMLPGYTHNIINLSDTEDLVTVMYCNEIFNPNRPDTFFDPV